MILIAILNMAILVGVFIFHFNISWSTSSGGGCRRRYVESVLDVWFWFTVIGLLINSFLLSIVTIVIIKNDYMLNGNLKYSLPTCIALVSFFSWYMWRICRKQKSATRRKIRTFFREMMPNIKPRSDHEMEFDLEMSGAHIVTVCKSKLDSLAEIISRSYDISVYEFKSNVGSRWPQKIDMTQLANYIASLDFKPNNLDDLPELLAISKIKDSKYSNLRKFL